MVYQTTSSMFNSSPRSVLLMIPMKRRWTWNITN